MVDDNQDEIIYPRKTEASFAGAVIFERFPLKYVLIPVLNTTVGG